MTDKTSVNALDNFLIAAKSVENHDQAVELINKILESPYVYSFSDFLDIAIFASVKKIDYN
jgi:hypothetical protein